MAVRAQRLDRLLRLPLLLLVFAGARARVGGHSSPLNPLPLAVDAREPSTARGGTLPPGPRRADWAVLPPLPGPGHALENAIRAGGVYRPWFDRTAGLALGLRDGRLALPGRRVLVVGDSHQQNLYMELVNLWLGEAPNDSTANPSGDPSSRRHAVEVARGLSLPGRASCVDAASAACDARAGGPGRCPFLNLRIEAKRDGALAGCLARTLEAALGDGPALAVARTEVAKYGVGTLWLFALLLRAAPGTTSSAGGAAVGPPRARVRPANGSPSNGPPSNGPPSCFLQWLLGFDFVVVGMEAHDLKRGEAYWPWARRHADYAAAAWDLRASLDGDAAGRGLLEKLLWVGGVDYARTGVAAQFARAQASAVADGALAAAFGDARVVDQRAMNAGCRWANCTLTDHHYARFVNRQKALEVVARMLRIKAGRMMRDSVRSF